VRPTYETQQDLDNEASVAKVIGEKWGVDVHKLKNYFALDYALCRDKTVVAIAEIKCRNYSYDKLDSFGGVIISAHKISEAQKWHDQFRIAFVLALKLTDGIYMHTVKAVESFPLYPLTIAGRKDRGDDQDIEPCCLISMDKFQRIS
jgi:hypothetical protein